MSETTTTTTTAATPRNAATTYEQTGGGRAPGRERMRRPAGRVGIVVLMIAALVVAGLTREGATRYQAAHSPVARRTSTTGSSLAGMDSYALALLLGGLRGPLVMILWSNSESQKSDRDLEGIDTQIEWIRRLQPEFDSVHIFQMWNKAYNISVQMVGLSNKYTVILDALDYGRSVDAERPDNMNILRQIASTYADKLGASNPEKTYYRERLRRETRHREQVAGRTTAQRGQPGFQRLAHDPILDAQGNILPQYLDQKMSGEYDGSELQFLKRFQPFPYGVSPIALGYNYHKRAQLLMEVQKQKPLQVSDSVVDAAPGLTLKQWAEEEWERARRMEFRAFGEGLPVGDRIQLEMPTAKFAPDTPIKDPSIVPELLYTYALIGRIAEDSLAEYRRHLTNSTFAMKHLQYDSHLATLIAMSSLTRGDHDYLKAMTVPDAQRRELLESAAHHYHNAAREFGLVELKYFTADNFAAKALPAGVSRFELGEGPMGSNTYVTEADVRRMLGVVHNEITMAGGSAADPNADDRAEYETYIRRADERIGHINSALANQGG